MLKRGLLLFLLLFVLVTVMLSRYLRPAQQAMLGLEPAETVAMAVETDCDARTSACRARVGEVRLQLQLEPTLRPLQAFGIELKAEGWQPQQVAIYFSMQGMEMGLNRFLLQPQDGLWRGSAMLPVCTDRRNDWLATVFVTHQGRRYRAEFGFTQAEID